MIFSKMINYLWNPKISIIWKQIGHNLVIPANIEMEDSEQCPNCKTTKYNKPSMKLMINLCGHVLWVIFYILLKGVFKNCIFSFYTLKDVKLVWSSYFFVAQVNVQSVANFWRRMNFENKFTKTLTLRKKLWFGKS